MDIPETEKLDVNVPSAFSDPSIPLISLSHFLFFFLSLFLAFTQRSMENHRFYGGLLPFFWAGERKKGKKTISLIFDIAYKGTGTTVL